MKNLSLYILLSCCLFACKQPVEPPKPTPDYTFSESVVGSYQDVNCWMIKPLDLDFDGQAHSNLYDEISNRPLVWGNIIARKVNDVVIQSKGELQVAIPIYPMDDKGNLICLGCFNYFILFYNNF